MYGGRCRQQRGFDGLGSVAALSDVNNVKVERYSYDVFGAPTIYDVNSSEISQSAIGNPYMFTARRADDETALYYYRARYYAFDIGRFLQTDPIGYIGDLNLYAYCGNNPVLFNDPLGLLIWTPWPGSNGYYRVDIYKPIRPPNAFEQQQINYVIELLQNTGDPTLKRVADRLSTRTYMVDTRLNTNSIVVKWGYTLPYKNPNTIYLNPGAINYMANQYGVRDGQRINTQLFQTILHEDWHLVSRYGTKSFIEINYFEWLYNDRVHKYINKYFEILWERYLESLKKEKGC